MVTTKRAVLILAVVLFAVMLLAGCGTNVVGKYVNKRTYIVLSKSGNFKEHINTTIIPDGEYDIYGTYMVKGDLVILNADAEGRHFPQGGRQEKWRIDGELLRVPEDPLGEPYVKQ